MNFANLCRSWKGIIPQQSLYCAACLQLSTLLGPTIVSANTAHNVDEVQHDIILRFPKAMNVEGEK
jgi:hypothetical protein